MDRPIDFSVCPLCFFYISSDKFTAEVLTSSFRRAIFSSASRSSPQRQQHGRSRRKADFSPNGPEPDEPDSGRSTHNRWGIQGSGYPSPVKREEKDHGNERKLQP